MIALVTACLLQDTTPPAAVTNLSIAGTTSTTVDITWTAPGDDGASGTAAAYDIRFSTAGPIDEAAWGAATPVFGEPPPTAGGTTQTMTVTGLSGGTTYHFAMKTRDEVPNWSTISNSPSATTAASSDTTPPAAVTNLAVAGTATDEVTVQWTAPGDDGSTGTAVAYDLRLSATPIVTDADFAAASAVGGVPAPGPAGTVQFAVVPLGGITTYWIAIKTRDEENNWSALSNVLTNSASPPGGGAGDEDDDDDKQGIPHKCGLLGPELMLLALAARLLRR